MSDCLHQGSSKSTADPELYEKNIAELNQLLAEGKKFELSESHEAAAEKYENAVKLASDYFGEFASEVFQPAFNYGKMLIEIARNQTGPIAPPVDLDEEDEEEPEDEQEEQKMDNQSEQQNGEADGGQNGKAEVEDEVNATKMEEEKEKQNGVDVKEGEPKEEKLNGKSETEMEAGGAKAVENGNENPPGDVTLVSENGEEKPTEEEEEEGGDIQTAWEWLEIARKICEKQEQTTTWLEHQADVHLSLGECMNVAEEFDQALTEFIKALEIRQKIFEPNNRYIAEVLFMIGVNYRNQNDFVNSAQQFEQAKNILQQIMEAKTKELEGKENDDSEKTKKLEELVELKQVVQSIEESIQDARESAEARARQLAMEMEQVNVKTSSLPTISEEDAAADNNVKVNDLTGLVKRKPVKRPHEEEDPKAGDKVMKAADELLPENGTEQHQLKNGTAETNGNGAADKLEPSAVVEQSIAAEPEQKRVKINMEVEEQQNGNGTQQAADH